MSYVDSNEGLLATVDLGSNSFRLLIAQIREDGSLQPIDQIKEIVRLTGGLDENDRLSPEKQAAALAVLARFSERLVGFKKNQVRTVGTSALRVAKNAEDFIVIANKTLGFDIEVISGTEEARLIYIGAMHSMSFTSEKRLVIDIGGGSTEFVTGVGYDPEIMESVTMGCVSFSNRYFVGGELNEHNFSTAILAARSRVQAMEHLFASHDWSTVVGTSGTARALYDLCIEHGFSDQISLDGLYKLRKVLIRHKNINNLPIVGLKDDRAPVIAGGLAIMTGVMEELNINTMTIANGSLREGVMYDLLGRKTNCDLRESTIARLKQRSVLDEVQGDRVARVTLELYQQIVDKIKQDPEQIKLLQWAAQVYETGLVISHNDYHKHGAYILANAELAGFSRPEQTLLADLVRAHRGGLSKAIDGLKNKRRVKSKLLMMILCFRLSVIFNRNRKDILRDYIIKVEDPTKEGFTLLIDGKWLKQNPLTRHSLNEEIGEWKKLDFKIRLVAP